MKDKLSAEEILDAICIAAPFYHKVIPLDCMIGVTDTKKFIANIPGQKMTLGDDVRGMELPPGDAITEAIRTGITTSFTVPAEAFGFAFKATGVPIKDSENHIIGGLGLGISLHNQEILKEAAQTVATAAEEITATTVELAQTSQRLAEQWFVTF